MAAALATAGDDGEPTATRTLAPVPQDAPDTLPTALLVTVSPTPPEDTPDTPAAVAAAATPTPEGIAPTPPETDEGGGGLPVELLVGGAVLLVVVIYGGLFLRGALAVDRYAAGFVVETCPVCGEGHLTVENRVQYVMGIPRLHRTVRCDTCRSVLREVGERSWRYAIDGMVNPVLYERLNGRIIDDEALKKLSEREPTSPPEIADE